jgi:hypothetical protein
MAGSQHVCVSAVDDLVQSINSAVTSQLNQCNALSKLVVPGFQWIWLILCAPGPCALITFVLSLCVLCPCVLQELWAWMQQSHIVERLLRTGLHHKQYMVEVGALLHPVSHASS